MTPPSDAPAAITPKARALFLRNQLMVLVIAILILKPDCYSHTLIGLWLPGKKSMLAPIGEHTPCEKKNWLYSLDREVIMRPNTWKNVPVSSKYRGP
jgi:hypothetical protein